MPQDATRKFYNSAPTVAKPTHMAGINIPALATAAHRFLLTHLSGSSRLIGGNNGRLCVKSDVASDTT